MPEAAAAVSQHITHTQLQQQFDNSVNCVTKVAASSMPAAGTDAAAATAACNRKLWQVAA